MQQLVKSSFVPPPDDLAEGRIGEWMHTASGGRFYPLDIRPEEIKINDIANGHALDCRYNGQGRVDRFYSVAEHTYHLAWYALVILGDAWLAWAMLFHDSPEGYLKDLSRAVKHSIGMGPPVGFPMHPPLPWERTYNGYARMEDALGKVIFAKVGLTEVMTMRKTEIKALDCRIVPLEKAKVMKYPQPWAYDVYEALPNVEIKCWRPEIAKAMWAGMYKRLAILVGQTAEEIEL